jgi:hypothetical protein
VEKAAQLPERAGHLYQLSYPDGHIREEAKSTRRRLIGDGVLPHAPKNAPNSLQLAGVRGTLSAGRQLRTEIRWGASMRTLGILWILYGLERFVVALAIFLCIPTLTVMWGALLTRVPNPLTLMDLFHVFLILMIILAIVAGIISILAGLALMSGGPPARKLGLFAAFLALVSGPLGIALGAYTLVVLVPAGARNA